MKTTPWLRPERTALLESLLAQRILVIDGAMGTMIQQHELDEADYRGERFSDGFDVAHPPVEHAHGATCGCGHDQRGNNDLLSLTRPETISAINRE
jgi:5-methyltetrahydrofolate--homocysteine methyltransferase